MMSTKLFFPVSGNDCVSPARPEFNGLQTPILFPCAARPCCAGPVSCSGTQAAWRQSYGPDCHGHFSNVLLIGRSRLGNLWLNTGHGTLGWTMACGSGAALADLLSGRRPEPDFTFC